ncbi:FAD-binding oxidoreductase [Vibrio superstes NBRC 103154]|uniref:D-2-hydroxyglutarate dehydrogenase n=2 Tax=Vibrio superstes TaxID=198815 RepID=A0A511QVU5_9VIBR|nr:FAD-binding oxidoreductase [Vibrio superstes NBRC 103154]
MIIAGSNMLPRLNQDSSINPIVERYLSELQQKGFQGDIETQYASRLAVATDNSVYQQLPQAVVHPRTQKDVELLAQLGNEPDFHTVRFSPRGGGTGTNGQSLTEDIVVDLSRHLNQLIEVNVEEGWVIVETGMVKDKLNDLVRPHGFFFSPELSTSNRATVGGMINTDASGQGSLRYGKTSDHVLGLTAVLADGSVLETEQWKSVEENTFAASAVNETQRICREHRAAIEERFPPLNRFLTGYDLKNSLQDDEFLPERVLCGSEGSLGFITRAKLNLTPIPKSRVLVNVKYDSFDSALRSATMMVEANALSVETIDSIVLNLAKQDIVWHTVSDLLTEVPGQELLGVNIVEYAGNDVAEIDEQVSALCSRLDSMIEREEAGIIGYQICRDLGSINKIYGMRKKAVGLLGATKGAAKPVAFAEDTCVPPENLADFIVEFRALLDAHNLRYGMFGHVDAGVLHVRPALDMCDPKQEELMHQISDQVVALVAKYGGLMWGEHGKGFRSEYGPEFFGEHLFEQLRRVKGSFDPLNKMNPGKICTPLESDDELVKVKGVKRAHFDRQIPVTVRDSFNGAMECNGNGLCFNYDVASPMCPSMKVLADRRHSPKGRAGIVREWLRQLSEQGVDILDLESKTLKGSLSLKSMLDRMTNRFNKRHHYDFSHEVYEAMQGCLACKACATQCPIKVDVPNFRARFLNLYHSRYQRPLKDYFVANIESLLPVMALSPKLVNTVLDAGWVQSLVSSTVGYVDAPLLSSPTLKQRLKSQHVEKYDHHKLSSLSDEQKQRHVIVVQDPFTSYYDAQVVDDFVSLLVKLGFTPVMLPFKPNGKAQHIKGFLKQFTDTAQNTSQFLAEAAKLKMPMVGVDPALVLCYRDEYRETLKKDYPDFSVNTVHEWLLPQLETLPSRDSNSQEPWYLLAHCTEKTMLPNAEKEWGAIFNHFGASLAAVPVGCCGMAGTFGHEADKLQWSKDIYGLSWKPSFERLPIERCLVTGYSCRSQVKRFEGSVVKHPLQALLEVV